MDAVYQTVVVRARGMPYLGAENRGLMWSRFQTPLLNQRPITGR
jgi:hypothetical protein